MRRADRLFDILQHLRGGRMLTARRLAEKLEVSERTIYRDIADLQASGVPIEGAAGVGYILRAGFDLPPLMFTGEEIEAVALGLRMAAAFGGARMAGAAAEALVKVEAVLPPALGARLRQTRLYAVGGPMVDEAARERLDRLNDAVLARCRLAILYGDDGGRQTERVIRPLGLYFWGRVWTLAAWCELREDFRSFRPDRIAAMTPGEPFPRERGRDLPDFLAAAMTGGVD